MRSKALRRFCAALLFLVGPACAAPSAADLHALSESVAQAQKAMESRDFAGAAAALRRTYAMLSGPNDPNAALVIELIAKLDVRLGLYDEAASFDWLLYQARASKFGPEAPETLSALIDYASAKERAGRYHDAEEAYGKLYQILSRQNETGPATLETLNRYAGAMESQNHHREAQIWFDKLVALWAKASGADSIDTLMARSNRAVAIAGQGRLTEADTETRQILKALDQIATPEAAIGKLQVLNNLAVVQDEEGDYAAAEASYRQVYDQITAFGEGNSDDALAVLNNLAGVMAERGRAASAEVMFRRIWEQRQKVLGKEHPDTLIAANNVAAALSMQGLHNDALPILQQTFESRRKILGDDNADTQSTLTNIAMVLSELGRNAEALEPATDSWTALTRIAGETHPFTLNALNTVATVLERSNNLVEAERYARKFYELRGKTSGPDHPATLLAQSNLADILDKLGHAAESERMQADAVAGFERRYGEGQPEVVKTRAVLGLVRCLKLGRCAEGHRDVSLSAEAVWQSARAARFEDPGTAGFDADVDTAGRPLAAGGWVFAAEIEIAWRTSQTP